MDQAERLRNLVKGNRKDPHREGKRSIGIYTVASGKGGVGKTNIAVNLAIALQKRGKKVLIIDADLGMANVDVVMGIYPEHTLYDVLFHEYPLKDAVITGYEGIRHSHFHDAGSCPEAPASWKWLCWIWPGRKRLSGSS